MGYDFDRVIERRGSLCIKYDFAKERGREEDVLPLWVADMDFQTAPEVLERLHGVVSHGIFGYSEGKDAYFKAVSAWYQKHFGWETERNWLVKTPGVVFAIAAAIRAFTKEGEAVLLQQPVYYPFAEAIRDNRRRLVNNPLKLTDGHYEIDFEDFEEKVIVNEVKLFLLCSPHNPVGRVWKKWELERIGEICLKHGVPVISDEIHSDFTYPGHTHLVFASLRKEFAENCIICTAPSKTFNLAGLQVSNIFIPNKELRQRFRKAVAQTGYSQVNLMGIAATQAAYETGEGTYLLWLDFRQLGLTEEEREELLVKKAKLWLDSGAIFGAGGEGFERINIACPKSTLRQALGQLEAAVRERPLAIDN